NQVSCSPDWTRKPCSENGAPSQGRSSRHTYIPGVSWSTRISCSLSLISGLGSEAAYREPEWVHRCWSGGSRRHPPRFAHHAFAALGVREVEQAVRLGNQCVQVTVVAVADADADGQLQRVVAERDSQHR